MELRLDSRSTQEAIAQAAELLEHRRLVLVFGDRLVAPAQFVDPTLRELASVRRRVVIKSCSWRGADVVCAVEWAQVCERCPRGQVVARVQRRDNRAT